MVVSRDRMIPLELYYLRVFKLSLKVLGVSLLLSDPVVVTCDFFQGSSSSRSRRRYRYLWSRWSFFLCDQRQYLHHVNIHFPSLHLNSNKRRRVSRSKILSYYSHTVHGPPSHAMALNSLHLQGSKQARNPPTRRASTFCIQTCHEWEPSNLPHFQLTTFDG